MGIMSVLSRWMEANQQKRLAKMQSQGKCPDCYGNGFNPWLTSEVIYIDPYDYHCPGCNGSGLYSDWESRQ